MTRWTLGALLFVACSSAPSSSTPPAPASPSPAEEPAAEPTAAEPTAEESTATSPPTTASSHAPLVRPSSEERVRVAGFLREGRRAAHAGDQAAALAAFREGLSIAPHDPSLLCEAGWAAFQLDDPAAHRYLEEGSRSAASPERRAACLYNLGRYFEHHAESHGETRDSDLSAAAAAYRESLVLRPGNAATDARYRALESHAPSSCPPSGRYASIELACDALARAAPTEAYVECGLLEHSMVVHGSPPAGTLRLIAQHSQDGADWSTVYLALEDSEGIDILTLVGDEWDRSCSWGGFEVVVEHQEPSMWVIEIHERGEYSCSLSPWDVCEEQGEEDCEALSTDAPLEVTDERYRVLCALREGRYRCSFAGNTREGIAPSARLGPIPMGADLDALLVCP